MKIVQIVPELNEGGVERGVVELNKEFVKNGIENIVITKGGKLSSKIEEDGGKIVFCDVCSKNIFTALPRIVKLRKILNKIKPDIIHVRSRVPAWMVKFAKPKCKFVSTVHGINSINFYSKIMVKADAIICGSTYTKDHIVKNYDADIEKITIVPRGVDLNKFNPNKLDNKFIYDFKKKFDIKEQDFIITGVGRITHTKDYKTQIRALSLIKDAKLLIVGGVRFDRDNYFNELKTLISELGLKDRVIFTGSQKNIAEIYAISDVVVSSSSKPESFGRSMAESIALNTPVVATNHGGAKDIIVDGVNGYFFEVGDWKNLASQILKAKKLKFDGFDYVSKNFSLEQMVKKNIEIYTNLIKK